ncbi:MAG: ThuA domain-containing protein [Bacteroidota bacterium]|nr:ThuA domain-containing protein [Bacteroidota bacterium]
MKLFRLLTLGLLIILSISASAKKLNVIVVTGGHNFDRESFFEMFDSFQDISYTELKHPEANLQLGTIDLKTFDAVVFYDMPKTISEAEKESYHKLLKSGKGLVFLHHSQCSYQAWDEYITIVGGKYHEEKNTPQTSTYQHDVTFAVKITDQKHPVTKGIKDFEILDEVYGNTEVLPGVTPLLTTDHPQSSKIIGWTHKKENSRIVYIQPGHDKNGWFNPNYQKLVNQAIVFVSEK